MAAAGTDAGGKDYQRHLPADPQAEFDHGRVLSLLIAARLYSPVALVNVGRWAADSGADILWDIPVEKLNDDRLGRSVAAFFEQRHSILASVALHVSHEFGVPLSEMHYDPTHLVLHGAYEDRSRAAPYRPAKRFAATPLSRGAHHHGASHGRHAAGRAVAPRRIVYGRR